ncbi:hypothetical protein F4804DRAFT_314549 [Jackrogersella minutella]|nr:hypothetical protein F4804DRAFT_314549 [Jackrogersella minutella]
MWLIKLSIGIFLLRLATQKRYRYTLYASIVIITIWSIVLFFWNIFQCNPVPAQWDYTILANDPTSHCVSADEIVNAAYALSVMTILSDWMYALLPIPMLWKVKMTLQAKLTVVFVLGLGVFASVATLVRLKFLADLTDMADILHAGTDAMVWTLIEPGVAIVASSLVTIRPLLRLWKIKGFGSTGQSRPTNGISSNRMSRTNRSNKMPAFGSTDVTLVDIESQTKNNRPRSFVAAPVVGGRIQRSLSVSDAASFTSRSYRSRSSSDVTMFTSYPQHSRSISDTDTLTGRSHRSKPSQLTRLYEATIEEDDARSEESSDRGNRRIEIRSEMYIIEGNVTPSPPPGAYRRDETWLAEQDSSNDGSIELSRIRPQYKNLRDSMTKPLPYIPPVYQR